MTLEVIRVQSPELPYTCSLPKGFRSEDELEVAVEMEPKSCLFIEFKTSCFHKDSKIGLSLTLDSEGLKCKWFQNNNWFEDSTWPIIVDGLIQMFLSRNKNTYSVRFDNIVFNFKIHDYPAFQADTLDIKVREGTVVGKLISLKREIRWLPARIDSPISEWAFKCGKDEVNNDIYLGRSIAGEITIVNPTMKETNATYIGLDWLLNQYKLLEDSGIYVWRLIGEDMKIPKNAISSCFCYEDVYIGRVTYEGALIPGIIDEKSKMLSIRFEGKQVHFSSGYEVLVALTQNKPQLDVQIYPSTLPENPCIFCCMKERTTAFIPCGHLGFCEPCAIELLTNPQKCLICLQRATSHLRIYNVQ